MKFNGYLPKNDERQIIKKFALFPITIYDRCDRWLEGMHYERRWLETVYIEQTYEYYTDCWKNCRFVDKDTYIKFRMENQ